tara:strand:+ start:1882 stop:2043 length:162 start_codon:yes stop_codon:yes gene_type:complete
MSIKINVVITIDEEIEIEGEDLMHQSIDEYMDHVRDNLTDYIDIDNNFDWEVV